MPKQSESQNWWTTVPGLLTALAGIITAVTGLILALHQAGVVGAGKPNFERQPAQQAKAAGSSSELKRGGDRSGEIPVANGISFPSGDVIQVGEGKERVVYKVLSGRLEERRDNSLALFLNIRVTNFTPYPVFCGNSIRLLVDEAPRSPADTTHLDTPIDTQSARDANMVFDGLPRGSHRVTVIVVDPRNSSGDMFKLPLDLVPPEP
ncbi:MAG TPA: hypothetical protein VGZ29_04900 [Terriglobia bacterium]|nr:hypothetical protein [Terriglobia bacterium]